MPVPDPVLRKDREMKPVDDALTRIDRMWEIKQLEENELKFRKDREMKTYKVIAASTSYVYCLVQAEDEQQAWDKAREIDGGDFDDAGYGSWIIDTVEEVTK